ncbi:MAG: hypothetical protein N2D54_13110 [Chloroflexota bacterium]
MVDKLTSPTGQPLHERNPITHQAHRSEMTWQVLLPLVVIVLVVGGIAAWMITGEIGTVEKWAEIATLLVLAPIMVTGLVLFVLLAGFVYGVGYILGVIPPYARMAQDGITRIKRQVEAGAKITARPVIQIQSFLAIIEKIFGKK